MLPVYIIVIIIIIFGNTVRRKVSGRETDIGNPYETAQQRAEAIKSGQIILLELKTDMLGSLLMFAAVIKSMFDSNDAYRSIEFSMLVIGAILFLLGTFFYVYVDGDDIHTFRNEYKISQVVKVTGDWILKVETTNGNFHLCFLHRQFSLDRFRERVGESKWLAK